MKDLLTAERFYSRAMGGSDGGRGIRGYGSVGGGHDGRAWMIKGGWL